MAVFRVEKTQNYTVMSNHHLRNQSLTLKAKGLLSQMLSLPEEWDYTLNGLAAINRERIDAIREAVKELEQAGYITRSRVRDEKGRLRNAEYVIHEVPPDSPEPDEPDEAQPILDYPTLDFPTLDNPTQEKPTLGNPTQLNKEESSNQKSIKELLNKESINLIPLSFPQGGEMIDEDEDENGVHRSIEKTLRENIQIESLAECHPRHADILREMFDIILDTATANKKRITIAGSHYSPEFVRSRLLRLTDHHLLYVLDCLKDNTTRIRNIKAYLLAALFNAPTTIDSYYTTLVNHDRAHGLI